MAATARAERMPEQNPSLSMVDLSAFPSWSGQGTGGGRPEPIPAKGLIAILESTDRVSQALARARGREWIPVTPKSGWILNEGEFVVREIDGNLRLTWGDTLVMVRTEEYDSQARAHFASSVEERRKALLQTETDPSERGHLHTFAHEVTRGEGPPKE